MWLTWNASALFCVNIQGNRLGRNKKEASPGAQFLEAKTGDKDKQSRVAREKGEAREKGDVSGRYGRSRVIEPKDVSCDL